MRKSSHSNKESKQVMGKLGFSSDNEANVRQCSSKQISWFYRRSCHVQQFFTYLQRALILYRMSVEYDFCIRWCHSDPATQNSAMQFRFNIYESKAEFSAWTCNVLYMLHIVLYILTVCAYTLKNARWNTCFISDDITNPIPRYPAWWSTVPASNTFLCNKCSICIK